ncbi:mitochondrial ribosomal protein S25-domain-containing protein [Hygrophoropsis aurantiaca]|uniref:Mitochondrial ribosomal protein S25-domain-containing protein n=1 Tax=Hygrophoropsis aurantiaca TaxID=72124 RepID=A0ACB8AN71_9AGAM|nr:mitochondrial ribosomal protein S25-domain-containing protein [Hygrophoropsis aurantiaca]
MVRRIASQVHKQAARLLRANYIKREPVWFQAVLNHPPLPLPPKAPPVRPEVEERLARRKLSKNSKLRPPTNHPLPIFYLEDEVRRQFFRDHPFEAFRAVSLVESDAVQPEHPIRGKEWTRLSQRGKNPTLEEAVRFAVNLHRHHNLSLSSAYARAVAQFRSLRSEHDVATSFARMEAEAYGAVFDSEIDRTFEKEKKVYESQDRKIELDQGAMLARKRWKAILDVQSGMGGWDRGQQYTSLWKQGVRPTYTPMVGEPSNLPGDVAGSAGNAQSQAAGVDFMGVLRR